MYYHVINGWFIVIPMRARIHRYSWTHAGQNYGHNIVNTVQTPVQVCCTLYHWAFATLPRTGNSNSKNFVHFRLPSCFLPRHQDQSEEHADVPLPLCLRVVVDMKLNDTVRLLLRPRWPRFVGIFYLVNWYEDYKVDEQLTNYEIRTWSNSI